VADHLVGLPLGIMRLPAVGGRGGLNWGFTFRFEPGGAADAEGAVVVVEASADDDAAGAAVSTGCGAGRFPEVGGSAVGGGSVPASGSAVGAGRLPVVGVGVHATPAR